MIILPSPNFNDRPHGMTIESIVIHYTGMKTAQDALERLCHANSQVSAHYTIDMDGTIYNHVHPDKRAWHAGVSAYHGRENFNDFSIGIELVNMGHEHGYHAFPDVQIEALITLMQDLFATYPIKKEMVLGHSDIAPTRKQDPGELFPWDRLVQENLALGR
jgi:N-acetylmuramoyl-L-alanine amidase